MHDSSQPRLRFGSSPYRSRLVFPQAIQTQSHPGGAISLGMAPPVPPFPLLDRGAGGFALGHLRRIVHGPRPTVAGAKPTLVPHRSEDRAEKALPVLGHEPRPVLVEEGHKDAAIPERDRLVTPEARFTDGSRNGGT